MTARQWQRFWSKVDRSAGPEACWPWMACRDDYGYGDLNVNGRHLKAHRLAWEFHFGPIPDGLKALHSCDNPPCCNPANLFTGTDADNSADMMRKGRWNGPRGEQHHKAKIDEQQVQEIRSLRAGGWSQAAIARRFCISQTSVHYILTGRNWAWLPEEVVAP